MDTPAHVVLVEACPANRARLAALIHQLGYEISWQTHDPADAVRYCRLHPPDILFLDADAPGTITAPVAIQLIREHHAVPVVLTAADCASRPDCVSKDTDRLGLARGIARAFGVNSVRPNFDPPQDFISADRILFRHQERMLTVSIEAINFFRAQRNYCSVFTDDAEYLISIPIQIVEHCLGYRGFLRTHRSYLVNYRRVRGQTDHEVQVVGSTIPIGKAYRRSVRRKIKEHG